MPRSAQDLNGIYRPLALPPERDHVVEPIRSCGTSFDLLRKTATGFNPAGPLADGRPLRADQVPRFIKPDFTGNFGFNNFLVLGDQETVTFERTAPGQDPDHTAETWQRAGTQEVAGRMVSVFNPMWSIDVLHDVLRLRRWGVDKTWLYWGQFVVPGTGPVVVGGVPDHENPDADRVNVYLQLVPPNIPPSTVTQINETVQFSSHGVNIWDADFGDSRATGGDNDLNETEVTQTFYEHFEDQYDVIAIVSQATQLAGYFGFHGNVRNDIAGIGLSLFDNTAQYGSAGVLQGVEGYPPGGWSSLDTVLHETAHQWNEYTDTWAQVGPPPTTVRGVIDRKGHAPDAHTPLLFPGEVLVGAVLEGDRRVIERDGTYSIERTVPRITFNPLTLYRMGHTAAAQMPTYQVFLNQGQFDEETSVSPEPGTAVEGERVEVSVNDMMAADGRRSGPTVTEVRRAFVYVSRDGLVPKAEMDIVNYYAKRLGESAGVTSWDRYPSFVQATGGLATMRTDITPKPDPPPTAAGVIQPATKIEPGPDAQCTNVSTTALIGFTLDHEINGCIGVGDPVTVSGTLNLTDRSDYKVVCFRFWRYGIPSADAVFLCASLTGGNRFSISTSFTAEQKGTYTVEPFAFWPNSGSQFPRSWHSSIEVRDP